MRPIAFFFGPLSVSTEEFSDNYVPLLKVYLDKGSDFIVCDADGVDSEVQKYLAKILSKNEQFERITLYRIFEKPRNHLKELFYNHNGNIYRKLHRTHHCNVYILNSFYEVAEIHSMILNIDEYVFFLQNLLQQELITKFYILEFF